MKKRILFAIIAALSAPAFADTANVNVYGKFDVSYDTINTGNGTAAANGGATTNGARSNRVESNTSYIGLKGAEDVGDGLSAIWQVESLVLVGDAANNGSSTTNGFLGTRNTYAGLSSTSWGTLLGGRHDTPYKLATRRFDQFYDGIADNRSILGGVAGTSAGAAFDGRQDQVIAYISPSLGGVTAAIAHVNLTPAASLDSTFQQNATSAAAWYDANGIYGSLAWERHNLSATTHENASKLGFGYTQEGVFTVGLVYEKTNDDLGALGVNHYGHSDVYVSGKFNVGANDAIKAAITHAGSDSVANTSAKQYSIGYDHNLSKRTTVYALYTRIANGAGINYGLSSNASVAGANTTSGYGTSPSAFAVGVKVTF